MKTSKLFLLLPLLISLTLLSGCFSQATTSPEDLKTQGALFAQATLTRVAVQTQMAPTPSSPIVIADTATSIPPTATEVPPTATEVPPTATSIPATATKVPTVAITYIIQTATPKPVVTDTIRLSFATGTTNVTKEGSVAYGSSQRYVFWAAKDQLIDVSVSSAENVVISIYNGSGTVLVSSSKGWSSYRGYLPANGDWYIDVKANPNAANFSLYLVIPQRLTFPTNSFGMTATGKIPGGSSHNFLVWANKGQTLKVSVSPSDKLAISIYHVDGTVLLSMMNPTSSYEGSLPEAGDYFIVVHSAAGNNTLEFSLPIEIK